MGFEVTFELTKDKACQLPQYTVTAQSPQTNAFREDKKTSLPFNSSRNLQKKLEIYIFKPPLDFWVFEYGSNVVLKIV